MGEPDDAFDPFEDLPGIPELLHSLEFDGPFTCCTQCHTELGKSTAKIEPFQLQKVMKHGEPIIEFALCEECHEALIDSFSETTKVRLEAYFEQHAIFDLGLDACVFCAIPRRELEEFNLSAHCIFDRLLLGSCICADCLLQIQPLISKQTRDSRDRFMERNFPGVPSDAKHPVLV